VQTVYRFWAAIVFLAIVVQVGFAGYGAFDVAKTVDEGTVNTDQFEDSFTLHAAFGYLVMLAALLFVVIALVARVGRPRIWHVAGLFGLLVVQMFLAWFGFEVPVIGFFHPVNALLIFVLSGWLARQAWRGEPGAPMTAPTV
jgi:Fe2+ transport system protein B